MRKVSSEAASISCIYFQQKISKNQEIRNWITVLQYQKKKKKKNPKTKNPKKPFRAYIYIFKFNNCQARSQNNTRGCLILLRILISPIMVQIPWQGREISWNFGINMETQHAQFLIIYLRETVNQLLISLLPFLKPISRLVANIY